MPHPPFIWTLVIVTIGACDGVASTTMPKRPANTSRRFTVDHRGRQIHLVEVNWKSLTNAEQWILLRSDAHHDSKYCLRHMELKHLREAVDRDALVLDLGDCLDLMQGVSDRRSSKSSLRSNLLSTNYFDRVIDEAAEFYTQTYNGKQLADQFVLIGQGNHESAWLKFHEVCPTQNLVRAIKSRAPKTQVGAGAYGGYVHLTIRYNNAYRTFTIRYAHGASSGGQMTMGALDIRRMGAWIVDADMIAIGHTHDSMVAPIVRERFITQNGDYRIKHPETMFVRCGTYKDEFGQTEGMGWAVEKGGGPKPLCAKWVRLYPVWEWRKGGKNGGVSRGRGVWTLGCDIFDAK